MIKIVLNGACGKMGREICNFVERNDDVEICARVDKYGTDCFHSLMEYRGEASVVVDFSHHSSAREVLEYAIRRRIPAVIATTGHTEFEQSLIRKASEKIGIFYCSNMSTGIALLEELAVKTALSLENSDIEIIETHHNSKLDSPSGSALMLARSLGETVKNPQIIASRNGQYKREKNHIGVQSVRRGNINGIHEVIISTEYQTVSIKHEVHSRALYAEGAINAARFIVSRSAGLYNMKNLIK